MALVVHHQQTGSADLMTQQLIDRFVALNLRWKNAIFDVLLPAASQQDGE